MLSQTKMQLWYPRTSSEENIKRFLDGSNKQSTIVTNYVRNYNVESDISENEFENVEYYTSEGDRSIFSSKNQSPQHSSDCEENFGKYRKRNSFIRKNDQISNFIDLKYWRKENLCCGTIFRGVYGEVIIDPSLMKPCENRLIKLKKEKTD